MMGMGHSTRTSKILAFALGVLLLCALCVGTATDSQAAERGKIVRIGYYKGDLSFQDGFTDSDRKSGYAYEYYQKLAVLNGWSYEYVYGTREEVFEKLLAGEVDVMAGVYRTDKRERQVLFSKYDMGLEGEARYLVVNPEREDLLEELNTAQDKLAASPNELAQLSQKYYSSSSAQQVLTDAQKAWLDERGFLRIGYVRANLPLTDQGEDGAPIGLAGELMETFAQFLRIPMEPVCYDTVAAMEEALRGGEIDAAFPAYSDLWYTEQKGFVQTNALVSDSVMIVYQGDYREGLMNRIAVTENGMGQSFYVSTYYPRAMTVCYDTKEEGLKAVRAGEVDCMIGCATTLQRYLAEHPSEDVNIAYLDMTEEFCIVVNQGERELIDILNKAVSQLDDAALTNTMIRYSNVQTSVSFSQLLRHYAPAVVAILGVFFAILLYMFLRFRRRTRIYNVEQAKTRTALEAALGAANAASVAKTTFLSSMSHDIRTPMNGIIGMTAIASAHMDDPARVKDCLEKITASGKHLLSLINEVLDMSKIESGAIQLNEEVIDLSELLDNLIVLNRQQAEAKHHDMEVRTQHIAHEKVLGDSLRIQQVLTNLVSNAIKYTPEGGRIEIVLAETPYGSFGRGCFQFSVKDNGVGMSEDYLPHVFEAFTREESRYAAPTQGTGLGMAIARNIARLMDGDITVESRLGEGSTFTMTMQLKLVDDEPVAHEEWTGRSVLVAGDAEDAESVCAILAELGMTGECAATGAEALERAEARRGGEEDYFAVLLDARLRDMSGVEAARALRERVGEKTFLILCAYDWSAIETEAKAASVNGFIGKPLFQSRLVHLFEKLLGCGTEDAGAGLRELTEQVDFTGARALLAEDNDLNAEIAIEILGMAGLAVEWAHNGKEALDMLEASEPGYYDCVFMDIQMPVMNGIEAAKAIRALEREDVTALPILAMTANAFAEDVQAVLDAGMNEHIAKPLNVDVLMKTLQRYLGEKGGA